jgi:hypothetical protein
MHLQYAETKRTIGNVKFLCCQYCSKCCMKRSKLTLLHKVFEYYKLILLQSYISPDVPFPNTVLQLSLYKETSWHTKKYNVNFLEFLKRLHQKIFDLWFFKLKNIHLTTKFIQKSRSGVMKCEAHSLLCPLGWNDPILRCTPPPPSLLRHAST